MTHEELFDAVIDRALEELRSSELDLFTFALYHDHEGEAVSVCADTAANSRRVARDTNAFNMPYFLKEIEAGNLKSAALWEANVGRSLSLGDFVAINLARTDLPNGPLDDAFYLSMVRSVVKRQSEIAELSKDPKDLVFAASGPDDEVALVWALPPDPHN